MTKAIPAALHHTCFLVRDLEGTAQQLSDALGIGPWNIWTITPAECRVHGQVSPFSFRVALADVGGNTFELITPHSGETVYNELRKCRDKSASRAGARSRIGNGRRRPDRNQQRHRQRPRRQRGFAQRLGRYRREQQRRHLVMEDGHSRRPCAEPDGHDQRRRRKRRLGHDALRPDRYDQEGGAYLQVLPDKPRPPHHRRRPRDP